MIELHLGADAVVTRDAIDEGRERMIEGLAAIAAQINCFRRHLQDTISDEPLQVTDSGLEFAGSYGTNFASAIVRSEAHAVAEQAVESHRFVDRLEDKRAVIDRVSRELRMMARMVEVQSHEH